MQPDEDVSKSTEETTEVENKVEDKEVKEPEVNDVDRVQQLIDQFNTKLDDVINSHKKEVEELKEDIKAKDSEITKLKNVNAQILMNTDIKGSTKEVTDFTAVDFDDVDWDVESKSYMDKIDSRIFS